MNNTSAKWLEISSWKEDDRSFGLRIYHHLRDHLLPHERNNYRPHVLHHRSLGWLAVFLCVVKIVAVAASVLGPVAFVASAEITVPNILALTNEARKNAGTQELLESSLLDKAAQAKAEDMLENSYFAHTSPAGVSPWDWFTKAGYAYKAAGENLAVNFSDDKAVVDAWLQSPGHRANLLNKTFTEIGIGIATGPFEGHNATFVVQEFGLPLVASSVKAPEPVSETVPTKPAPKPAVKEAQVQSLPTESISQTPTQSPTTKVERFSPVTARASDIPVSNHTAASNVPHVLSHRITTQDGLLKVNVIFDKPMSSVTVNYRGENISMKDASGNQWQGQTVFDNHGGLVSVKAISVDGQVLDEQIGQIENSTPAAFGLPVPLANTASAASFSPAWNFLQNSGKTVYPILITLLLTAMLISILVHRHVRHIAMIANASFVVILACVLWVV